MISVYIVLLYRNLVRGRSKGECNNMEYGTDQTSETVLMRTHGSKSLRLKQPIRVRRSANLSRLSSGCTAKSM